MMRQGQDTWAAPGAVLEGTGKACDDSGCWKSSVTFQGMKLGRALKQDIEASGGYRKCQREPSFSLLTSALENSFTYLPADLI